MAETCAACTSTKNTAAWCNGECEWSNGACVPAGSGNPVQNVFHTVDDDSQGHWWWLPLGFGIHCFSGILVLIYACIYKVKIVDQYHDDISKLDGLIEDHVFNERKVGLCDMWKYPSTALWAIFCTPVLAAKNYQIGKAGPTYWCACIVLFVTLSPPFYLIAVAVRAIWSMRLQANLRHKMGRSGCCRECIVGLFCFPCAVGRDSLEVDEEEWVEVTCPFRIEAKYNKLVEHVEHKAEHRVRDCVKRNCNFPNFEKTIAHFKKETA